MTERLGALLNLWRWPVTTLVGLMLVFLLSLGFGSPLTPSSQFLRLAQQDSIEQVMRNAADTRINARLDSLVASLGRSAVLMEGLARARCSETPRLAVQVGLPCRTLMGSW